MNIEPIKAFFLQRYSNFYSFAFVLLPDDLQASQLVVDSITQTLIRFKEEEGRGLSKLLSRLQSTPFDKNGHTDENFEELELNLLRSLYQLAEKRFYHLNLIVSYDELSPFFALNELREKASLYLKYKFKLSSEHIAFVLSLNLREVNYVITYSRIKLLEKVAKEDQYLKTFFQNNLSDFLGPEQSSSPSPSSSSSLSRN